MICRCKQSDGPTTSTTSEISPGILIIYFFLLTHCIGCRRRRRRIAVLHALGHYKLIFSFWSGLTFVYDAGGRVVRTIGHNYNCGFAHIFVVFLVPFHANCSACKIACPTSRGNQKFVSGN